MQMARFAMSLVGSLTVVAATAAEVPRDGDVEDPKASDKMETVTIVGSLENANTITGGAHIIDAEQLAQFAYTDVQRLLRQVPGVSIQVEDGYGLRPNIGIRGVATERSARITLMEDGVLIAPAPYSAPAAYYFPTAGRMTEFEILKGPAAITQGPYTIGGALNMVSTHIPKHQQSSLTAVLGQHGGNRIHTTFGDTTPSGFGFLLETHQWRSDGYQIIDRHGTDTGLVVRDYTLKLAYTQARHSFHLKLQRADQHSDQSYLGLTDADFHTSPARRYGVSQLDGIDTNHRQAILRYDYDAGALDLAATAYRNTHARNWFKTEGVDLNGSANAEALSRTNWAAIVQAVNNGKGIHGWSASALNSLLQGTIDTAPGSIELRANDRQYTSQGVDLRATLAGQFGATHHKLRIGVRFHEDEEDRLQRKSTYRQRSGELVLDDLGLLGNAGNRIQSAKAWALFVQDRIEFNKWTIAPGLRFEAIDQNRVRYETRAGRTNDPSSRSAANVRSTRRNRTTVLLPGVGVLYRAHPAAMLIAGIHKGFTAPSNVPGVRQEEALNFEFGVRAEMPRGRFEAMAFLSDYDNLLGTCTASSGVDCEVGDAFNGDAATVRGFELTVTSDILAANTDLQMPLTLAYTWMDATFDTDIADTDFFGDVSAGDPLPYIPEHQLHASLGLAKGRWKANLAANFVGSTCVRASCGAFESTDDSLTADFSAHFRVSGAMNLFVRVENLANAQDIVGRHPYGARPNRARTAALGLELTR